MYVFSYICIHGSIQVLRAHIRGEAPMWLYLSGTYFIFSLDSILFTQWPLQNIFFVHWRPNMLPSFEMHHIYKEKNDVAIFLYIILFLQFHLFFQQPFSVGG